MLLIAAFLRATALVIAGYFVWFAASKAEGRLKTAGNVIAGWCAVFAVVLAIAGITSAFMHQGWAAHGPRGAMMRGAMMPGGMMGPRFLFRERGPLQDKAPQDLTPKSEPVPPPTPPKP